MDKDYVKKLNIMCAVVPFYSKSKNKLTLAYYTDGKKDLFNYSVNRIINDYCAINMTSFKFSKKICSTILSRKNNTPFLIKDSVIFPIKTVKPFYKGDKCFGFINMAYINNFMFADKEIFLAAGHSIHFIEKEETIKKRLAECTILSFQLNIPEKLLNMK